MSYQARAFQISLLFHGVIIALAIIISTFVGQTRNSIILDFDVRKAQPRAKEHVDLTGAPALRTESINPPAPRDRLKKESPGLPRESASTTPAREAPPVVKLPEARRLESSPMGQVTPDQGKEVSEGSPGTAGESSGTGTGDAGGGSGSAGTGYLNENYAYIRDRILKNVGYPDMARRNDWQGKVVLSFIVTPDGSVRDLRILQSSGHRILDRSAMETVRDSAPFPRPPGEAQLVIPITYRLE
jgi:protein TonB